MIRFLVSIFVLSVLSACESNYDKCFNAELKKAEKVLEVQRPEYAKAKDRVEHLKSVIESVEEYLQLFKTNYGAIDANWVSAIEYNQLYPQPDYESSEDSDKHLEELNAWQEKQQKQLPHPEIMKALVSLEDELWQPTRDWGKSNNCWGAKQLGSRCADVYMAWYHRENPETLENPDWHGTPADKSERDNFNNFQRELFTALQASSKEEMSTLLTEANEAKGKLNEIAVEVCNSRGLYE